MSIFSEINGDETAWTDLGCQVRTVQEVFKPVPGCPSDAISVEIGYENPIKQNTNIVIYACYSKLEGRTLSVHTALVGNTKPKDSLIKSITSLNYLVNRNRDNKYRLESLDATRSDDLDPRLRNFLQVEKIPFFQPRQLIYSPLLQNGQFDTALRAAWNFAVVNGEDYDLLMVNYDSLLKDITDLKENRVDLYMGTHEILSLKNNNQELKEIYLFPDEKRFQVPTFLWVCITTESGKGAGFLISNDIDAKEEDLVANAPCESKCAQMTWLTNILDKESYKNPKNGYVLCCELDSFMRIVNEMHPIEGTFPLLK